MSNGNRNRPPIRYTSRDFESIKEDLIDYAKRYYPETFRDFSDASFGSLMIDSVSYIGDILSFYIDYQVNEMFLDTAVEYLNIIRQGRQVGYHFRGAATATGECSFFIQVPSNTIGSGPDTDYMPILKKGTSVASTEGATFLLDEDIDFSDPKYPRRVGPTSATGMPEFFIISATGKVISGQLGTEFVSVGSFERFKKVQLSNLDIVEILSVFDSEGHQYYEVDYLSQNVVYRSVLNRDASSNLNDPVSIIKPFVVPRRFVIERSSRISSLQFGYGSESERNASSVAEPSNVVLDRYGRDYSADSSFDPSRLLDTDKFGVGPSNTTLTISFRKNSIGNTNAPSNSVNQIVNSSVEFKNPSVLNSTTRAAVVSSLEVRNVDPIVGSVQNPSADELRANIAGNFAAQNRAVTEQDYKALVYSIPPQFGGVKRCAIYRDSDSFKRNLNLYVISEDNNGNFVATNNTVKENLKTWLGQSKMINDTIDILDAKVVNYGIDFTVRSTLGSQKYDVLRRCAVALNNEYQRKLEIGESIFINDIYQILNRVSGVVDVIQVRIINKYGSGYSNISFSMENNMSQDGSRINVPKNVVFELKYPTTDIRGTIK
jgi:hypothetical protein